MLTFAGILLAVGTIHCTVTTPTLPATPKRSSFRSTEPSYLQVQKKQAEDRAEHSQKRRMWDMQWESHEVGPAAVRTWFSQQRLQSKQPVFIQSIIQRQIADELETRLYKSHNHSILGQMLKERSIALQEQSRSGVETESLHRHRCIQWTLYHTSTWFLRERSTINRTLSPAAWPPCAAANTLMPVDRKVSSRPETWGENRDAPLVPELALKWNLLSKSSARPSSPSSTVDDGFIICVVLSATITSSFRNILSKWTASSNEQERIAMRAYCFRVKRRRLFFCLFLEWTWTCSVVFAIHNHLHGRWNSRCSSSTSFPWAHWSSSTLEDRGLQRRFPFFITRLLSHRSLPGTSPIIWPDFGQRGGLLQKSGLEAVGFAEAPEPSFHLAGVLCANHPAPYFAKGSTFLNTISLRPHLAVPLWITRSENPSQTCAQINGVLHPKLFV